MPEILKGWNSGLERRPGNAKVWKGRNEGEVGHPKEKLGGPSSEDGLGLGHPSYRTAHSPRFSARRVSNPRVQPPSDAGRSPESCFSALQFGKSFRGLASGVLPRAQKFQFGAQWPQAARIKGWAPSSRVPQAPKWGAARERPPRNQLSSAPAAGERGLFVQGLSPRPAWPPFCGSDITNSGK